MQITVGPVHFDDFSGLEFERLVFAYVLRMKMWCQIDWLGQSGSEGGRDIWGICGEEFGAEKSYCFQCKNCRSISFSPIAKEIDKLAANNTIPNWFFLICGGTVSANTKAKTHQYAISKGVEKTRVWSRTEFEERLRRQTPSLLQRFVEGEPFPDTRNDMIAFTEGLEIISDQETLALMARCFDRPAFRTPFWGETSLPAFEQAISDTIEALNTGIWRARDGTNIRRLPSKYALVDKTKHQVISEIVTDLIELRMEYRRLVSTGDIRTREVTGDFDMLTPRACKTMDGLRGAIFAKFASIYPDFSINLLA